MDRPCDFGDPDDPPFRLPSDTDGSQAGPPPPDACGGLYVFTNIPTNQPNQAYRWAFVRGSRMDTSTRRRVGTSTRRHVDVSTRRRVDVSTRRCVDASRRRCVDASTRRSDDASTHRRIDASTRRDFDASMRRCVDVSTRRRVDASTLRVKPTVPEFVRISACLLN